MSMVMPISANIFSSSRVAALLSRDIRLMMATSLIVNRAAKTTVI